MNWLATILILAGYALVTSKNKLGFLVQSVGCIIFIALSIDPAITAVNAVFLAVNAYGFYKWRKVEQVNESSQRVVEQGESVGV